MGDKKEEKKESSTGKTMLNILLATIRLLNGSQGGSKRKDIRQAFKSYRKVRRMMKKNDGEISKEEQAKLDELMNQIMEAQDKLLNF